jgi:hypothetical protein
MDFNFSYCNFVKFIFNWEPYFEIALVTRFFSGNGYGKGTSTLATISYLTMGSSTFSTILTFGLGSIGLATMWIKDLFLAGSKIGY